MLCCTGHSTSMFEGRSCFQGIPQERGGKMSNPHVCCAVGGTGIPRQLLNKQLFCHSTVTRPCSPLRQGARVATELPASKAASPHSSKQGQNKCHVPGCCQYNQELGTALISSCGAQRTCSGSQNRPKKKATVKNPTSGSKEYQEGVWKKAGVSLAAACWS